MIPINFCWKTRPELTRWAHQSLDFLTQHLPTKLPIIASYLLSCDTAFIWEILSKEIVLVHYWMMHVQFGSIIPALFGLMMLLERRTPWYLLKMEGTKVHVGIGTFYRRIHQFPLTVWSILLVHYGMFEAWKWLTYIGGRCLYSVGAKSMVVVPFWLLERRTPWSVGKGTLKRGDT